MYKTEISRYNLPYITPAIMLPHLKYFIPLQRIRAEYDGVVVSVGACCRTAVVF